MDVQESPEDRIEGGKKGIPCSEALHELHIEGPELPGHPVGCMCDICFFTRITKIPKRKCDKCGRTFNQSEEGAAVDEFGFYCVDCGKSRGIIK